MSADLGRQGAWTRAVAGMVVLCCLGLAGCDPPRDERAGVAEGTASASVPEALPSEASTSSTVRDPAELDTHASGVPNEPGLYALSGANALAFRTGMSRDEVRRITDEAHAAGVVVSTGSTRAHKELRGREVEVITQELRPVGATEVASIRLTFFGALLVGVMVTYNQGSAGRARSLAAAYGPGTQAQEWIGWWLRDQEQVVQVAQDGTIHEIFDLHAARAAVPEIDTVMLDSWRRRYTVPPPWGAALVDTN